MNPSALCPKWFAWLPVVVVLFTASGKSYAAPPVISNLDPSSAIAGGPQFALTVNGSGFGNVLLTSTVLWNGSARPTTFVSSTQLTAAIAAADIATAAAVQVRVLNQSLVGGTDETSGAVYFTINNPVPVISSLSPTAVLEDGPNFTLTVNGSNYVAGSRVRLDNSNRTTTFVSSTRLTASIEHNDIRKRGSLSITVVNPTPGGGTSNAMTLAVTSSLTITTNSTLPAAVAESPYSQTLAATGGLLPYSWSITTGLLPGGLALSASTGVLSGTPSASGSFNFTVQVSDGGQPTPQTASKAFTLVVSAASPVLTSINPSAVPAGGPAFTLTVNGTRFVSGSAVRWNGSNRTTTFVSTSQLTASISASDIASPGAVSVTVINTGGSTSGALTFTISPPLLKLTTSSPLSSGAVGIAYSQTFSATGGQTPYSWSIDAGSPPDGLTLAPATGVLSGTPSASGSFDFTVRVSDSGQPTPQTASKAFTLVVSPGSPVLTSINPSAVPAGGPAFTLTVNGTRFVSSSAVRWNGSNRTTTFVSTSQLTASISASDIASPGAVSVTVINTGGSTSGALTFTISPPLLNLTTSSPLSSGAVGVAYSQTFSATGGQTPYSWSIDAGSPPNGLTLAPATGVLSGTPSASGSFHFTVRVSDSGQPTRQAASKAFTLVVSAAPVLTSIDPGTVSAGGPAFTLTLNGSSFVSTTTVRWNGSHRNTTFLSSVRLTASIPASDIEVSGSANITVINPGGAVSKAVTLTITSAGLTVISSSPLSGGTVGKSYSQTLTASGGLPPYTWSVSSGKLPTGLALNSSSGALGGIPTAVGNSTFTVRVLDSASASATKQFQVSITSTTTPTFTISGVSNTVEPAQQPSVEIVLTSTYPSPISGQLTLKFTSNADVASDDPSIQFSTNGRTIKFSIPANSTRAVFANNASSIAFQTGTVAGTIDLSLSAQSGESPPISFAPTNRTLTLGREAPAITRLDIASRNASSFELAITGFSTPRSLTQATFLFTAAQGANLETNSVTVTLTTAAANWFQSQTATPVGGQFRLQMPFAVQGEASAIQSVSVTLTNSEGTSSASSVQF